MAKNLTVKLIKKALPRTFAKPIVEALRKRQADFFVVSFPKSGRTWLRFMLTFYFSRQYGVPDQRMLRFDNLKRLNPAIPRIHFTHDDVYQQCPERLKTDKSFYFRRRVIFLVRDPRDVIVSLYFHRVYRDRDYSGSLSEFVFGKHGGIETLIEFYNIWAANLERIDDKLLVRYEDMRNDPKAQLERVLHFLQVPVSDEYLAYAIDKSSFDNMKRYEAQGAFAASELRPGDPSVAESFKVRKGRVGGYRAYLTAEEIRRIDELIDARLVPLYRY